MKRSFRSSLVVACAVLLSVTLSFGATWAGELEYPIIAGFGGVARVSRAVEPPQSGAKIVFDVTASNEPDAVGKGLDRAARLLNLYGLYGMSAADVEIVVVLHGESTRCALSDQAYHSRFGTPGNPSLPLIKQLQAAGVKVFVCGQALHYKQFPETEVAEEVPIASAAMTVLIERQRSGFAYLPVP